MELQLKVCGMKYAENIAEVAALNLQWMGFVFYPLSKRYVGTGFDSAMMSKIPRNISKVGVFVNEEIASIVEKVESYDLQAVQLHGEEELLYVVELRKQLGSNVFIIKAFGIDETFNFKVTEPYLSVCDYFLFDTKVHGYGGGGKLFNWGLLSNYQYATPYFLSGGIDLGDIPRVKQLKADGHSIIAIDVNSRMEIEPGLKDISKLEKLTGKLF